MEKLSLRLQTVLSMIPTNSIVADVGSDHGKLMISLYEKGIISLGFAIENKKGPYNRLKSALISSGIKDNIVPIFSDGITDLPNSVNTVVVAGMGGKTIIDILYSHKEKLENVEYLVIDAHGSIPEVRRNIVNLGYEIVNEKALEEEGIFYEIILFKKSKNASYSIEEYEFGPVLLKTKEKAFKDKYLARIEEINVLLTKNLPNDVANKLINEKEMLKKVISDEN